MDPLRKEQEFALKPNLTEVGQPGSRQVPSMAHYSYGNVVLMEISNGEMRPVFPLVDRQQAPPPQPRSGKKKVPKIPAAAATTVARSGPDVTEEVARMGRLINAPDPSWGAPLGPETKKIICFIAWSPWTIFPAEVRGRIYERHLVAEVGNEIYDVPLHFDASRACLGNILLAAVYPGMAELLLLPYKRMLQVLVPPPAALAGLEPPIQSSIVSARNQWLKGDVVGAMASLQGAARVHASHPHIWYEIFVVAALGEDYAGAERALRFLLSADSRNVAVRQALGECLFWQKNYAAARDEFLNVIQRDPCAFPAWEFLGETYVRLQREEDASRAFKRALYFKHGKQHSFPTLHREPLLIHLGDACEALAISTGRRRWWAQATRVSARVIQSSDYREDGWDKFLHAAQEGRTWVLAAPVVETLTKKINQNTPLSLKISLWEILAHAYKELHAPDKQVQALHSLADLDPHNPSRWIALATCGLAQEDVELARKAINTFQNFAQKYPKFTLPEIETQLSSIQQQLARLEAPTLLQEALFRIHKGDHKGASIILQKLVTFAPTTENWHLFATALINQGAWADAAGALEHVLAIDPDDLLGWKEMAKVHAHLGQVETAKEAVARFADLQGQSAGVAEQIITEIGADLNHSRQWAEAVDVWQWLISLDPASPIGWEQLALAQDALGNRQVAITSLEKLVSLGENPRYLGLLGEMLIQAGEIARAMVVLERALNLSPGDINVLDHLTKTLELAGNWSRLIAVASPALAAGAKSDTILLRLATALRCQAKYLEAVNAYRKLAIVPGDPETQYHFGYCLYKARQFIDAASILDLTVKTLGITKTPPRWLYVLGKARFNLKNHAGARFALQEAARRGAPANATVYLGAIALEEGQVGEARALFERALQLDPQNPWAKKGLEKIGG